ncbi:hypothetical protein AGMMS49531_07740 [Endomicrobiia bacterium]|nr:hypothetical protein AGMMS49531_07740 [Endomicrobiia bacterium]
MPLFDSNFTWDKSANEYKKCLKKKFLEVADFRLKANFHRLQFVLPATIKNQRKLSCACGNFTWINV